MDAVTTDDIILAGLATASRGRLKLIGKPFTAEYYGIGIKKGNTRLAKRINAALKDMMRNGSWKRALNDNLRGTGFKPNAKYNPPVPQEGEE